MHKLVKVFAVVALAGPGLLVAGSAQADDDTAVFGQHVQMHAQMMGFDGSENPGMHQGAAGWGHTHMHTTP